MILITPDTRLGDVVIAHPEIIEVIHRFGLRLGVGDKSLSRLCADVDINADFLAVILNTFLNDDYFPENRLRSFNLSLIKQYLLMADLSYTRFHLPTIERHFGLLLANSRDDAGSLSHLHNFFRELSAEISKRNDTDNRLLAAENLLTASQVASLSRADKSIEEKLLDLLTMLVKHISGEYEPRLCQAVILGIVGLRRDVANNNRLRSRLLYPSIKATPKQ